MPTLNKKFTLNDKLTIKLARTITSGDISNSNSKMLGSTFGLSPDYCKTGAALSKVKDSVCYRCYAKRGTGIYPSVKQGRCNNTLAIHKQTKLDNLSNWIVAMVFLINKRCKVGYHRWMDAGDLQSYAHYIAIIKIAELLPEINFWLSTKEKAIINRYRKSLPKNLCVRLSGAMVDGLPPNTRDGINTSTVHHRRAVIGFECPSQKQGNKCLDCTACYNKNVANISYHKH
jgi:hypothetical protein